MTAIYYERSTILLQFLGTMPEELASHQHLKASSNAADEAYPS